MKGAPMKEILTMLIGKEKCILQRRKNYMEELSTLPKGSISSKKRGASEYFQRVYWANGRSNIEYLGMDKDVVQAMQEQLDRRKYLEEEMKYIEYDLKAIKKMLDIGSKQVRNLDTRAQLRTMRANKNTDIKEKPAISNMAKQDAPNTYTSSKDGKLT